jgi:hypothetical protein
LIQACLPLVSLPEKKGVQVMADAPLCPKCQRPMKLVASLPAENDLPAVEGFRCDTCNEEVTRETD